MLLGPAHGLVGQVGTCDPALGPTQTRCIYEEGDWLAMMDGIAFFCGTRADLEGSWWRWYASLLGYDADFQGLNGLICFTKFT